MQLADYAGFIADFSASLIRIGNECAVSYADQYNYC